MAHRVFAAAALMWLIPASAAAQTPNSDARPTLTAVRVASPPTIDGRLDDAMWRTAALIDAFVQEAPVEGAPATEQTEVRVAYDSDQLYFGIYAHYSDMSLMRANRTDRDRTDGDDTVGIVLEPFLDYLRGYAFSVNGYGVQGDSMIVVNNGQSGAWGDSSWNALYASAGQLVEDGWTAEMAIPIRSVRYPSRQAGDVYRWGLQVRRRILSKNESVVWSPVSRDNPNFLAQLGMLDGMTNLSTRRNFELQPTFTAVNSARLNPATGGYTTDGVKEGGLNVKYGLSSNLTFDFTYNPDFSTIESDTQQIEVNQRFPVNYPELRPFFLEGQEIYDIPGRPQPVHTRRIVDPRYGAKLTGKLGNRTSIGLVVADDEAPGKVDSVADPAYGKSAQNILGRVKYDLYRNSHVGVIFTDREFMGDYSRLVGADLGLGIGQTNNVGFRYFQAKGKEGGTGRSGWASEMSVRHNARNLRWGFTTNAVSPAFATELGFVQRVDQVRTQWQVGYRWWPETWITNWGPGINHERQWDFDGVRQDDRVNGNVGFTFAKNIRLEANAARMMERYRGIEFHKTRYWISGDVSTSRTVEFSANFGNGDQIRFVENSYLGRLADYGAAVTLRPFSRLQTQIRLDGNRFTDPRTDSEVFDVKILRLTTTYQFTDRLLVRNIVERHTLDETLFNNVLVTYRVNSGTAVYLGYDDRYRQGGQINADLFQQRGHRRTNRAFFTKFQYLFRRG